MNRAIPAACFGAVMLLAGCASTEVKREVQADKAGAVKEMAAARSTFSAEVKKPILLPTLHTPYFDGESVAVAPARTNQPAPLMKFRQFHIKGPNVLTTQTLAQAISEETGLPVVIDQSAKQQQGQRPAVKTVDVSALPVMPIEQFLNVATATLGIDWEWADNALHLSSTTSRTYHISNTTSTSKGTMKLGKSGTAQAGASTGNNGTSGTFNSQLEGEITNESDPWGDIEAALKSIAGADGVVRGRTLGLFVVNCSKACHKQVKEFVDTANHIMTQQVLFHIVEMTVETSSKGQSGINWNVLYKQMANKYSVSFGSPTSLVSGNAGNIAFNILNPTGGNARGFDGSTAIFEALSAATHVIEAKPFDMLAINNEPTTLSNINQQTFTASTSVVPTGIAGTPIYTQNPGYVTYGQLIQILPTILPEQKVLVRFGIDDTKLKALIPASTPNGMDKVLQGGLSYQTKAVLKIGSTLILSGFKVKSSSLNEQGILPGQRGGTEAGSLDSTETIIMITPYLAGV